MSREITVQKESGPHKNVDEALQSKSSELDVNLTEVILDALDNRKYLNMCQTMNIIKYL